MISIELNNVIEPKLQMKSFLASNELISAYEISLGVFVLRSVLFGHAIHEKEKKKNSKVILNIENKYLETIYVLKITTSGVI